MDISIIIVNYNVKELIIPCIDSITKYMVTKNSYEIIVVNNSINERLEKNLDADFQNIKLINNSNNVGFSKAVNQGFKKASGEYILILNPDTLFIDDSLEKMLQRAKKSNNPCIIGPKIMSAKMRPEKSHWKKPRLIKTILSLFYINISDFWRNYSHSKHLGENIVDTVSGCAMLMKRSVFSLLEGFNPDLFWMEDIDFCVRAKERGYETIFFPNAQIIHYGGQSSKSNVKVRISNQVLSKIKYFKIHHTKIEIIILNVAALISILFKLILLMPTLIFFKSDNSKFFAYLYTLKLFIKRRF